MQHFISGDSRHIVVRLDDGDLLLESLQRLARELGLDSAAIVCGFGALKRTHIHVGEWEHTPPKNIFILREGPAELCAPHGFIANGRVHAHITASNGEWTIGGHLEPETIVLYLCEIVIQVIEGLPLRREMTADGLPLLQRREL